MIIFCKNCGQDIFQHQVYMECAFRTFNNNGIISFSNEKNEKNVEEITRDNQASGYLNHIKVASQSKFFERFLSTITSLDDEKNKKIVLDLGCGPGVTVKLLVENGYEHITAIDFSEKSLIINREHNISSNNIKWIQADLQHFIFEPNSVDILIMSDFIQHVGTHSDKMTLIQNALNALKPGGRFYLSFFNFNILNYFKSDLHGTFSNGTIPYERLLPAEITTVVKKSAAVYRAYPMNITHNYIIDKYIGYLPFSKYIARMYAIEAIKYT